MDSGFESGVFVAHPSPSVKSIIPALALVRNHANTHKPASVNSGFSIERAL